MGRKSQRLLSHTSAGALFIALAFPSLAQAQVAPAQKVTKTDDATVADIIVTAQFHAQKLQDTPLAITAISAETIEQRNQTNVTDIAGNAPNITVLKGGSGFGMTPSINIRGIGAGDYNFALSPAVGVYLDDVYVPTLFGSASDLVDIDRIEILRGPQGTLAGKNSVGGAIKIFSKAPGNDLGGYLEAGYGSYNTVRIRGAITVPLVPDILSARITAAYSREDGYVTRRDYGCLHPGSGIAAVTTASNCVLGKEGGTDHKGIRAQLRWTPTPSLQIDLSADYSKIDDQPAATKLIYARNLQGIPETDFARFLTSQHFTNYATYCVAELGYCAPAVSKTAPWGVSGRIGYKFSDSLSLVSISAYRAYKAHFVSDGDGGPLTGNLLDNHLSYRSFTQEVRLNGTGEKLDWTIGGYYSDDRGIQAGRQDVGYVGSPLPPFALLSDFNQHDVITAGSIAGFVHGTYHVTDRLSLTLGYRYTHDRRDYTFNRTPNTPDAALTASTNGVVGRFRGNSNDYRATVDYRWSDALMTYATFSTGFRGGGINPRPFVASQVQAFGPERLQNYEVGFKSEFFDRRLIFNVSAFYDKYLHIQESITSGYGGFPISAIPVNSGDADLKGAEVEFTARPAHGLSFDGSVSYIDFTFKRLSADALSSGITYDMVSPFTPRWKASIGGQYEIPLGKFGTLTPRLDINYQSSLYTQAVNTPMNHLNAYTVLNGKISLAPAGSNWLFSLAITNLTNHYYYLNIDDTYQGTGSTRATPARPRTFFVSVKRSF